jgi:hypothetical protein
MNNLPLPVKKYLVKYFMHGWEIIINTSKKYENILVIPAISEYENIKSFLNSFIQNEFTYCHKTLIVFVINNLASSSEEVRKDNAKTIEYLKGIIVKNSSDELSEKIIGQGISIGFINASSTGKELPENNGGVGLARKIGMDLALTFLDYESRNKKLLICTDADCTVQNNYLKEIINQFNNRNLSAAVVNYEHDISGNDENTKAIICYEYYLRYYVLGLKYSHSPYAFHSIGSTIVCDYESYIKVEGMNKRKAAEDFYFLEKLAKVVEIGKISSTAVYPSGRPSWRVPFGTGQRVNRFLSNERDEYKLYNPESFEILKKWISALNKNYGLVSEYLAVAEHIHPELYKFLIRQEFDRDFSKILNHANDEIQLNLQKKQWFDGFRTLKLIHYLRDTAFPEISTFDAIDSLFEKMKISYNIKRDKVTIPELSVQKEYLELLREIDNEFPVFLWTK